MEAALRQPSVRAGATRAFLLPLTSGAALYTAHVEIRALGPTRFGVLALLLSIALLLPFADLGVGAVVTNSVAAEVLSRARRVVAASLRLLVGASVLVILIAAALTAAGLWSGLTGATASEAPGVEGDMLVVMILFALGLPFALGARVLLALDRYPLCLALQACVPFLTLAVVIWFRDSTALAPFLFAPFAAQLAVSVAGFVIACRLLQLPPSLLWELASTRTRRIAQQIRAAAAPMLLITIGLPLALQTDRLVLSHVSSPDALAQYAILAVIFGPAWSVMGSAGLTLWPKFAVARTFSNEKPVDAYRRAFRWFGAIGGAGAIAFVGIGPILTGAWAGTSGGGALLWAAFALLLLVQAAHLPGGMFLTRPAELRFQARCVVFMCAVNLPLSVGLAGAVGAAGPVLASAATVCAFQLMPARRRILRHRSIGVSKPC